MDAKLNKLSTPRSPWAKNAPSFADVLTGKTFELPDTPQASTTEQPAATETNPEDKRTPNKAQKKKTQPCKKHHGKKNKKKNRKPKLETATPAAITEAFTAGASPEKEDVTLPDPLPLAELRAKFNKTKTKEPDAIIALTQRAWDIARAISLVETWHEAQSAVNNHRGTKGRLQKINQLNIATKQCMDSCDQLRDLVHDAKLTHASRDSSALWGLCGLIADVLHHLIDCTASLTPTQANTRTDSGTIEKLGENLKLLAGLWYRIDKPMENVIAAHKKAIDIMLHAFKEKDLDLNYFYNNLASAYHNNKEYQLALTYFQKALAIQCANPKYATSTSLAIVKKNIGLVYLAMTDYQEAIDTFNEAITLLTEDHTAIQEKQAALALAELYYLAGSTYIEIDHSKILDNQLKALSLYRTHDPQSEMTAKVLAAIGKVHAQQSSPDSTQKALQFMQEAKSMYARNSERHASELASLETSIMAITVNQPDKAAQGMPAKALGHVCMHAQPAHAGGDKPPEVQKAANDLLHDKKITDEIGSVELTVQMSLL